MFDLNDDSEVRKLFSNLDDYYQTNVIYKFNTPISNDTLEYLEDSFPRTNHFNEFVNYSDTYEITYYDISFIFEGNEEVQWFEDDDWFFQPNDDCPFCPSNEGGERCRDCMLNDFKNTLYNKLRTLYNNINTENYDDNKCILSCGFHTKTYLGPDDKRDLSNPGTLYCRIHSTNFSADLLMRYRENLKNALLEKYNEIINFLKEPLPLKYEIHDENYKPLKLILINYLAPVA